MVRFPSSIESAAAPAARSGEVVSAASSTTGIGAIHMNGHRGFMPFPASNRAAVERTARVAKSMGRSSTKGI